MGAADRKFNFADFCDAQLEVLEFCEILLFCFWDLEDQSLTDIVSYIIFCLEIFPEMSYYLWFYLCSTIFSKIDGGVSVSKVDGKTLSTLQHFQHRRCYLSQPRRVLRNILKPLCAGGGDLMKACDELGKVLLKMCQNSKFE